MPKINPLMLAPGKSAKIVNEAMAMTHGLSKSEMPMVSVVDLESKARSVLDLSTEELGYYTYNGRIINVVFPR